MPAIVTCKKEDVNDIKSILTEEILKTMESINSDEDELVIKEVDNGLDIEFPIGEIYGYTSDYVQMIPEVFKMVKEKYRDVAIWGIAYEYETISAITFGPLFYCKSEDLGLKLVYKWQECDVCCNIAETDVVYNSSQWDFGEGNVACVCCPTCMLKYLLNRNCWGGLEPNASFTDDEIEEMLDSEDTDSFLKPYFIKKIKENIDEYIIDFRKKKDEIIELSQREDLTDEEKELIDFIMKRM